VKAILEHEGDVILGVHAFPLRCFMNVTQIFPILTKKSCPGTIKWLNSRSEFICAGLGRIS
jgi:hypothetical protein